jgi:hypothetical protein
MTLDASPREVVERFWDGIGSHDWAAVAATLAPGFVRVGLRGDGADVCHGGDAYVRYVSEVLDRVEDHAVEIDDISFTPDERLAVVRSRERILAAAGEEPVVLRMVSLLELDEQARITRLDMYAKTPERTLPSWVTEYESAPTGAPRGA